MTDAMTPPADLYRHGMRLLLDKDIDGWVALFADDALVEFPFAPDGFPSRLEGRAALAAYMRDYPDRIDMREVPRLDVLGTDAPGTVVAEMRVTGLLVATGEPYAMDYIVVMTAEGGRIVRWRDYWNPLAVPAPTREAMSLGAPKAPFAAPKAEAEAEAETETEAGDV
ncbi:nuclear transport factor 2 family protein [Streptomyces sp. FIT100]|uniref:nuclear transport factor 2 family protein n=1 Tax=Streptomyces sp. FIT100 TaxID=2837956 RepID=UPI00220D5B54|nr:nuclear transport factor 2 family protein [Streptomyces sp. FIT100]UUN27490.1 nuclear transport factor 2 family protein [Streptomyces sp. FIT100]